MLSSYYPRIGGVETHVHRIAQGWSRVMPTRGATATGLVSPRAS